MCVSCFIGLEVDDIGPISKVPPLANSFDSCLLIKEEGSTSLFS